MSKVVLALAAAVLATIVAAKVAYDANVYSGAEPVNQPWAQGRMEFVTRNGAKWTAWIRDGAFDLRPHSEGRWSRHANASIAYTGWEGQTWQAKIDGEGFLLAHRGEWDGVLESATAIRYRDWKGRNKLRTVAQLSR